MTRDRRAMVVGVAASTTLGAVAGYVDALSLRLFGVFPANQSGNAIFLGVAVGNGSRSDAWRPALAMAGFVVGVALAVWIGHAVPDRWRARVLVAIEVILVANVALDIGNVALITHVLTGTRAAFLLAVLAIAMGVQTEIIRTHAGVALSTTYETGALARVAEHVVDAVAHRPDDEPVESRPRRVGRHRTAVAVLLCVLTGYIGGAAVGARLGTHWGGAFAIPVIALVVLLVSAPAWMAATVTPPATPPAAAS